MKLEALAVLAAVLLWGVYFLRKHSSDPSSFFKVSDLLIGDDSKASKAAFVMYVALGFTSWVLVYVTLNRPDLLTAIFIAYTGVWATPAVTALIVNAWKQSPAAPPVVNIRTVEGDVNTPKATPNVSPEQNS
jgi:hypothetical protein